MAAPPSHDRQGSEIDPAARARGVVGAVDVVAWLQLEPAGRRIGLRGAGEPEQAGGEDEHKSRAHGLSNARADRNLPLVPTGAAPYPGGGHIPFTR
jgi:hypothetical protein